jgi:hypothetical protein
MSGEIAAQGVQFPAGDIHVIGSIRKIEPGKLPFQFRGMVRADTRLAACFEKALQSFMPEALNHGLIV